MLTQEEQMEEALFLGLRLVRGVDALSFRQTFGRPLEEVYGDVIEKNIREELLEWRENESFLALTRRGLDISNYVMAQFLFS